ncbi:MAG: sulfatase-like hydrolase/transferase [Prosthecobacter sp.]
MTYADAAQLGRVSMRWMKSSFWDRTVVIFVGDHGYHTGERNWWNKNTLFERSCRAPFIIAAPNIRGGRTTSSLVEFVDVYPTVADFCGLKIPHEQAGVSLRPVLEDPTARVKDAAYTLVTRGPKLYAQSIRTDRWRCTLWSDGQTELYDHGADPEEHHDVSVQHADVVAELTAKLRKLTPSKP